MKVLLTRPKRKQWLLAYQPEVNDKKNTQYLAEIVPFMSKLLYKGNDACETNNRTQSNIKYLSGAFENNGVFQNEEVDFIVTCEAFAACFGGSISIDRYNDEIKGLPKGIPFLVNGVVGDYAANECINGFIQKIRSDLKVYLDEILQKKENDTGAKTDKLFLTHLFAKDIWLTFNHSLYRNPTDYLIREDFYKRDFNTPTADDLKEILSYGVATQTPYINGSFRSFYRDEKKRWEIFIKICSDMANPQYFLRKELEEVKRVPLRFVIFQSDSYSLAYSSFFASKDRLPVNFPAIKFKEGYKQDNSALEESDFRAADNGYPWPKKLVFSFEQPIENMFTKFLMKVNYIICADSSGYSITDDKKSKKFSEIKWDDISTQINDNETPDSTSREIFYVLDFLKDVEFNNIYAECNLLKFGYFDGNFNVPTVGNFFDSICEVINSDTKKDDDSEGKAGPVRTAIKEVTGLDYDNSDVGEDDKRIQLYNALADSKNANNNKLKVHFYSPKVGNIYKIELGDLQDNTITLTQVKRTYDKYTYPCDYGLFDLDQIDPVPPPPPQD